MLTGTDFNHTLNDSSIMSMKSDPNKNHGRCSSVRWSSLGGECTDVLRTGRIALTPGGVGIALWLRPSQSLSHMSLHLTDPDLYPL